MGDDFDLAVADVADADGLAEVTGAAVNLDARLQEGGEGRRVEDLVVGGLLSVDDVLLGGFLRQHGFLIATSGGQWGIATTYLLGDLLGLLALGLGAGGLL